MPKVPHGSGLDARTEETKYVREAGFGHWEIRQGVRVMRGPGLPGMPGPHSPGEVKEHGWAGGFPIGGVTPPPPGGAGGQWLFDDAVNSSLMVTAGF